MSNTPTIQAGGNVNFGNITGLVAIGDNIVQYQNCNIVLPDGSTVPWKSWKFVQGVRPTTDPKSIFGRQQELEKIKNILTASPALAITGYSGTGKSTLASMYVDEIEECGKYAGIYWRKVNETTDLTDIVGSFFRVIGKPIEKLESYKVEDLISLLFAELEVLPYFLVLDNFESLVSPQTNKPVKPGFSELIEKAVELTGQSRILFTCWECPSSDRGITPELYQISGLDEQSAIQLLRKKGLTDPEDQLLHAAKNSGGHPLALILLSQLIKKGQETLSEALTDSSLWQGEIAENIMDKVYLQRLSEDERLLLQYTSLFREPIPVNAIVAVANDSKWTVLSVKKLAFTLNEESLLNKTVENYWEEYLIQTYAQNKIDSKALRHNLACDYYLSVNRPEKPSRKEDVQSLIEAHYHACMAREYDKAAKILFDTGLYEALDLWGNNRTLVELCLMLLPKDDPLKGQPLLSNKQYQEDAQGQLGQAYYYLDDYAKAFDCYNQALAIARQIGDKLGQGIWLGGIGNVYDFLGDYDKAIEYLEQALEIAKQIGDKQGEDATLGNLGNIFHRLGDYDKAIEYLEQALEIARQIGRKQDVGAWLGNLGNNYISLGDDARAIEYYTQALEIARQIGNKRDEGTALGNIGAACDNLGDYDKAIEYRKQALEIARQIGDKQGEGAILGNIGVTYGSLGDYGKAIEYHKQALTIARQIGDKPCEGAWLRSLGIEFNHLNKYREALACYLLAVGLIEKLGNAQDLANVSNDLENLKQRISENEFNKLRNEVVPKAEEILQEALKGIAN